MSPPSPTGNLEVGSTPSHVALAPGGATAYIVNQYGRRLTIVNTETNTITDTVPLGHEGYNVAVAPNGARVYVTTGDGWVMEVNAVTRAIVDSVQVGAGANGLAFHPTAPRLFVSSVLTGTVAAINTTSLTVERTYTVGGMPQRIAVAPSGTTLYAANEITGIDFLNLTSGAVTSTPLAPPGPVVAIGLALSLDGYYAYVGMANGGKVEVVDVADRTVLMTITTGGDPRNIAIAPGGGIVIANQAGWIDFVQ